MHTTLLILIVTLCTIGSQLLLKRAMSGLGMVLRADGAIPFLFAAAASPWVWAALALQVSGYVMWMFVLTRAQLGQAFAISGSFFYLIMAGASWLLYGERLSLAQWIGLVLISAGVLLVGLGGQVTR